MIDIIKRPIITEKSTDLQAKGKYVFEVDKRANKHQIKKAVEGLFGVSVSDVRTIKVKGKLVRRGQRRAEVKKSDWKKAVVTLKEGSKIEIFETGG